MIGIQVRGTEGNQWRITVSDEVWEFGNTEDLEIALKILIGIKDEHGRIDKRI